MAAAALAAGALRVSACAKLLALWPSGADWSESGWVSLPVLSENCDNRALTSFSPTPDDPSNDNMSMVLGIAWVVTAALIGNTAAGRTVICNCWMPAISVGLRPGMAGAFKVLALAAKPAPETAVTCAPLLAGFAASCVATKLSKEGAVLPLLAVASTGVCISKGLVAGRPEVVMVDGRAVIDAVDALGASPNKFWMVDSSKPMDLAKAAKLSGLGAFLGSVMMRTWGLSSMVCRGVAVCPWGELAAFCAVATASAACAGLWEMNEPPTKVFALS